VDGIPLISFGTPIINEGNESGEADSDRDNELVASVRDKMRLTVK